MNPRQQLRPYQGIYMGHRIHYTTCPLPGNCPRLQLLTERIGNIFVVDKRIAVRTYIRESRMNVVHLDNIWTWRSDRITSIIKRINHYRGEPVIGIRNRRNHKYPLCGICTVDLRHLRWLKSITASPQYLKHRERLHRFIKYYGDCIHI